MEDRITLDEGPSFNALGLSERMLSAIHGAGFESPTPIQAEFIPVALTGRDCIGQARTGTGKTAAFVIPILEQLDPHDSGVQALILSPTRELGEQVRAECHRLAVAHNTDPALLVGGRPLKPQLAQLAKCPSIVVGTPGRVIDMLQRGALKLDTLKFVILDEADRMLDIGFRPDIERILRRCPTDRQTLLLSATLPAPVERLAQRYMREPLRVDLSQDTVVTDNVRQFYCTVERNRKLTLLVKLLLNERPQQVIVFCRTKRGADEIQRRLQGCLPDVAAIHGDLQQRVRDRVIRQLRDGSVRIVIATDIVGRGIDISGISHIINYDIPEHCDDYVHRIGRTGRISSEVAGRAFTFVAQDEGEQLTRIEMRINKLLEEYRFDGVTAFQAREVRHVEEDQSDPVYFTQEHADQWDDILGELQSV